VLAEEQGAVSLKRLLILGMVALNVFIYGAVFVWANKGDSSSDIKLTPVEAFDLQMAHKQALSLALVWQPDAQLVGATASWQLSSGDRLTLHQPAWSFSFYSPATSLVQVIIVDRSGAQSGPQQRVEVAPQYAKLDWNLGSDDLLLTFLGYGGEEFIGAHPGANVHLQLKGEDDVSSIWYITAIDPVARQSLTVGVDAISRQIVMRKLGGG
jgi:hypothetical protein